jgi:ubiquinone biosynthesis protein UbiJ
MKLIQSALNRYLSLDPESSGRVNALRGKKVLIECFFQDKKAEVFSLKFSEKEIEVTRHPEETPDIIIKGTPISLLRMSLSKDKKKFFSDDVTIEGDLESGQQVIDLFDQLEIDWEEYLSKCVGDVPAHHVGNVVRDMKKFSKKFRDIMLRNVNEYVHEETEWFPTKEALQDFFAEIDKLRMDVDRLEARVCVFE